MFVPITKVWTANDNRKKETVNVMHLEPMQGIKGNVKLLLISRNYSTNLNERKFT